MLEKTRLIGTYVEPHLVAELWPFARPLIWNAIKRGGLSSFAPIEASVLSGRARLWLVTDLTRIHAAVVTELHESEWRKVCVIVAVGGENMRAWLPMIADLERYARAEGCSAMRVMGRKGWMHMLPDYQVRRVILEKDID